MISRREFMKNMAVFSVAAPAAMSAPLSVASDRSGERCKALVCVLLDGGNDSAHMVIPTDAKHYQEYINIRPDEGFQLAKEALLPTPVKGYSRDGSEVTLGLHPVMTQLADVFGAGHASIIANSGILKEPLTKEEAQTQGWRLPPFLFSHNSQKSEWAKGAAGHASVTTGWAGRLMDVMSDAAGSSGSTIAPLFSHAGDAPLLRSQSMNQNIIRGDNIAKHRGTDAGRESLKAFYSQQSNAEGHDAFDQTLYNVGKDSIDVAKSLIDIIDSFDDDTNSDAPHYSERYPDTSLGLQFRITSRLIRKSAELGHNKQIYFLSLGGFDTHADQIETLAEKYQILSDALSAFNQHLLDLGLHDDVITITMSDFGRCLVANGTGTDHGWGGHQLIMGGAIRGGEMMGVWPEYSLDGPDTIERGRLLPSTAADQVNISLARWLGALDPAIHHVFPNADKFEPLNVTKGS